MADAAPDQSTSPPPPSNETQFTTGRRAAMMAGLVAAGGGSPTPGAPPVEAPAAPEAKPDPAPQPETTKPTPEPQPPDESAAIRKQEIHLRRQMAEERERLQAEYARKESEYKPKLDEYDQLKAKVAAAQDDPIAYLELGGWTADKLGDLARLAYAHSPEGAKDPRNKLAAHQTKAQRDADAKLAKMQERIDAFERQQQEQRELAELQARVDGYYNTVTKAVTDESPIVRGRLAAMPEAAKERMLAIADKLYVDSGPSDDLRDVPEPAEIIKAYEAERRAELETDLRALPVDALRALLTKLGVDPATVLRPTGAVQPPAGAPVAGQPRPSTTLTPSAGSPTQAPPKGRLSRDEMIAEARRIEAIKSQQTGR